MKQEVTSCVISCSEIMVAKFSLAVLGLRNVYFSIVCDGIDIFGMGVCVRVR